MLNYARDEQRTDRHTHTHTTIQTLLSCGAEEVNREKQCVNRSLLMVDRWRLLAPWVEVSDTGHCRCRVCKQWERDLPIANR